MITNPTPITASTFSGMWINSLQIFLPSNKVQASFLPYDGTHLLATGGNRIFKPATGSLATLIAKVKALANKTVEPTLIQVFAADPAKPVSAQIIFSDKSVHRIADCYALAGTDSEFATIFSTTMAMVASLGGYSIS